MIEVERLRGPDDDAAWDSFLLSCRGGLVYHSTPYRDLLVELLGCEPEYLVAREAGEVRGVLPLMWAEGDGGRICNSLPYYGSHGGPVAADETAERRLLDAWNERVSDAETLAGTMVANPFGEPLAAEPIHNLSDERIGQVTSIEGADADALMETFSKNGRRDVRRAERRGVEVERDPGQLLDLWRLHKQNMDSIGGTAKSRRFFELVPEQFRAGEGHDLWVASKDGDMIAGLLVLYFGSVAEYWTPAVDLGHRADEPMALILLRAMAEAAGRGFRLWNWGGTWTTQDGVFRFKRKWAAEERPYRYFVQVNDERLLEATPEALRERFGHFYVVPYGSLRAAEVAE